MAEQEIVRYIYGTSFALAGLLYLSIITNAKRRPALKRYAGIPNSGTLTGNVDEVLVVG